MLGMPSKTLAIAKICRKSQKTTPSTTVIIERHKIPRQLVLAP